MPSLPSPVSISAVSLREGLIEGSECILTCRESCRVSTQMEHCVCVLVPTTGPGARIHECAGPTLPSQATGQAARRAMLWPALLGCPSLPPPTQRRPGTTASGGSPLPLPGHLGFPRSPPAEGVVSVVLSATAHFPLGSPGNQQKATTLLTQTLLRPASSSVSHYEAWAGSRAGCAKGVLLGRAMEGSRAQLPALPVQLAVRPGRGTEGVRGCWVCQVEAARFRIRRGSQVKCSLCPILTGTLFFPPSL